MLRNVTCLLIQDENNYYLTPYTDENEKDEKISFSLTNSLTSITIWPHKDEQSALADVQKQLCLKFIELKNKEYASDLRATSSVDALMQQLTEGQKTFVNAVMAEYAKNNNATWTHAGRSFSTDIVPINLKNVAAPEGFFKVSKEHVDNVAFQHASLETLKTCVGWPAMKTLNADPTNGKIIDAQKLFHPFALQLNNTINSRKAEADAFAASEASQFEALYNAAKQSQTAFQSSVSDEAVQKIYNPLKMELEAKLATQKLTEKPTV